MVIVALSQSPTGGLQPKVGRVDVYQSCNWYLLSSVPVKQMPGIGSTGRSRALGFSLAKAMHQPEMVPQ
jgi:hypothetical protein